MGAYIGQNNATELLLLVGLVSARRSCASPTTLWRRS